MASQLTEILKKFNKECNSDVFTQGIAVNNCQRIPFTSPRANSMLYGGLPRGRVVEFCGAEGSGKTTTAFDIVANAQAIFRQEWEDEIAQLENKEKLNKTETAHLASLRELGPKKVMWIDVENTFDEEWAETLGVNVHEMYFMSPDKQYAEQILDMVSDIIDTGEVGLAVIDSIAMMLSKQEFEKSIEEKTYGGIAMAMTRFSRLIEAKCMKTNCLLIGINQLRDKIDAAGYGGPTYTTPGGRCWKHACSVRLLFREGSPFDAKYIKIPKKDPNPYGHFVEISVLKSKVSKPNRKGGSYTLTYDDGINALYDLIDLGIQLDVIHKSGGWFTFIVDKESGEIFCRQDEDGNLEEVKVQGQANLIPFLMQEENKDLLDVVTARVNDYVKGV